MNFGMMILIVVIIDLKLQKVFIYINMITTTMHKHESEILLPSKYYIMILLPEIMVNNILFMIY